MREKDKRKEREMGEKRKGKREKKKESQGRKGASGFHGAMWMSYQYLTVILILVNHFNDINHNGG